MSNRTKAVKLPPLPAEVSSNEPELTRNQLEEYYQGSLITSKGLKDFDLTLYQFLGSITRYANIDASMLIFKKKEKEGLSSIRVIFFTQDNEYTVHFHKGRNYIGAIVRSRKSRPGETWQRGRDLADGNIGEETYRSILADIVAYEIKNLQVNIRNKQAGLSNIQTKIQKD